MIEGPATQKQGTDSMEDERYPGEQQGLRLFLEEIRPIVEVQFGRQSLLFSAIRKALSQGTLYQLRHARQIFNRLPRSQKQSLSRALVARSASIPNQDRLLTHQPSREPAPFVCFERDEGDMGEPEISYRHESHSPRDLHVVVQRGILPSAAAASLRLIADTIERDRRVLATHPWSPEEEDDEKTPSKDSKLDCG